jgi:hypothetical protein
MAKKQKSYEVKWAQPGKLTIASVSFYATSDEMAKRQANKIGVGFNLSHTPRTITESGRIVDDTSSNDVTTQLVDLIQNWKDSDNEGQRQIATLLHDQIKDLPPDQIVESLRNITEQLENALFEFSRRWLYIAKE